MKNHNRLISEEVEENPENKDGEEDDHGDRVPEEAEEEDDEHNQGVVEAKVVEVASDSGHGVGVGDGERKGGQRKELLPWAAVGD